MNIDGNKPMQEDFAKQFIKGKIGELIFEQMYRETGNYTVIPFGYETVMPEIVQLTNKTNSHELLDTVRNAPDFALISHVPKEVMLVEVKYRFRLEKDDVLKTSLAILKRWKLAHVFYATPGGFYFDQCTDLVKDDSKPTPLLEETVSSKLQEKYISLLKNFIRN